jgi:hypothetical protein
MNNDNTIVHRWMLVSSFRDGMSNKINMHYYWVTAVTTPSMVCFCFCFTWYKAYRSLMRGRAGVFRSRTCYRRSILICRFRWLQNARDEFLCNALRSMIGASFLTLLLPQPTRARGTDPEIHWRVVLGNTDKLLATLVSSIVKPRHCQRLLKRRIQELQSTTRVHGWPLSPPNAKLGDWN